jgi:Prokaryotic N-terminal methylation motif
VSARPRRRARGFSMLEVLISGAVLLIAITGYVQLFRQVEMTYQHQRLMTQALHVAEARVEELLILYADDPWLAPGITHAGPGFDRTGKPVSASPTFTTSWIVTGGVPLPGTRKVEVTVTWQERGETRTFTLSTVRT